MNYRHAYHAGNFADVIKHVVLTRILEYLKHKPGAFRVIDTHAGIGVYDLSSEEAQKTGEWHDGIGKLLVAEAPQEVAALLTPYLDAVQSFNVAGEIQRYPGSPVITRHLLRNIDRLTAIELHPTDYSTLKSHFEGDWQVRAIELDGYLAMGAHLPPKEKRGLVLVDPPFEKPGEFGRLIDGLLRAVKRWPGGTYALWYPIKDHDAVADFRERLRQSGIPKMLDIRFEIRQPSAEPRFDGTGMIVVNPPFVLDAELRLILPWLHTLLCDSGAPAPELEWLGTPA